jgi:hypothetical protein
VVSSSDYTEAVRAQSSEMFSLMVTPDFTESQVVAGDVVRDIIRDVTE